MDATPSNLANRPFVDRQLGAAMVCAAVCEGALFFAMPFTLPRTTLDGWSGIVLFCVLALTGLSFVLFGRGHPYRTMKYIPFGATLFFAASVGFWLGGQGLWLAGLFGLAIGMVVGAHWKYFAFLIRSRVNSRSIRVRSPWFDRVIAVVVDVVFLLNVLSLPWQESPSNSAPSIKWVLLVLSVFFLVFAWVRLFRPLFESCVEAVVWRNYRITASGPGTTTIPATGPLLVIANHACWWDPLFIAKVLPRPITPMMTSVFYDKWFLRPLMVYVFQTIRVADARIRREAPEIQEAIQALDAGKCVVIFPEAFLRRKEEVPLRRFGRGVWEILKARPDTTVVACWIEGAWGSYASYFGGPPTKNKLVERRRPIAVGLSAPRVLPTDIFAEHLRTRIALMNDVSAARLHLGLPALPPFELPTNDEKDELAQPGES